jgi:hypothetical protein
MQTLELEADISHDGAIYLPLKYKPFYGKHVRVIVLAADAAPALPAKRLLALRGVLRDDREFDAAIQECNQAWQAWKPSV